MKKKKKTEVIQKQRETYFLFYFSVLFYFVFLMCECSTRVTFFSTLSAGIDVIQFVDNFITQFRFFFF